MRRPMPRSLASRTRGDRVRPVPEGWPWAWWDPPPAERERVRAVLEWARRRAR